MASTLKDLEGWKIVLTDESNNVVDDSQRRSRRQAPKVFVHLERESDGLMLTRGDSIIMNNDTSNPDNYNIYLIHEIRLNTMNHVVEILGLNYLRWFEMDPKRYYERFEPLLIDLTKPDEYYKEKLENEIDKNQIYLTAELSEIWLTDFRGMANILKVKECKENIEEKIRDSDFSVNYICDPDSTNIIDIDFESVKIKLLKSEPKEAQEYLKRVTISKIKEINVAKPKSKSKKSAKSKKLTVQEIKLESDSEEEVGIGGSGSDNYTKESSDGEFDESNDESENTAGSDDSNNNSDDENVSEEDSTYGQIIKQKRKRKTTVKQSRVTKQVTVKIPKSKTGTPRPVSSQLNTLVIRKFTKRNVARAKKKYTPFSKRYKSIKDIPDLTKLAEFNQTSMDLQVASLEAKLQAPTDQTVVETIFSKVKKQLYSSHGREEIVKSTNFNDYLPARENEFASIYLSLYSAVESGSATTVYVAGTPGVGKTLTVREVIKELQQSVAQDELPGFQYVEINGLKMVKPTDGYEVLWNKISGERLTWGAAMESLEFYFNKVPKNKKRPVVVLLDELDALVTKAQDIMYNFFNWTTYENAKLIVVAVANTMDLPERQLGNKVSSRIGFTRIMFTGYTHEELKSIIDFRLKGLNNSCFYVNSDNGSAYLIDENDQTPISELPKNIRKVQLRMSDDAIEIAARKVASVSGDARRALKVCKRAAEIAEQYYITRHGYSYDGLPIGEVKDIEKDEDYIAMQNEGKVHKNGIKDGDNEDIQTVHISHIMKALNETMHSPNITFISRLSFSAKLFLYALLNLIRKNSSQEQQIGDLMDEIRLLVDVNSTNKYIAEISNTLFQTGTKNGTAQIRMVAWSYLISQLMDAGVIIKQQMKNERRGTLKLHLSIEDLKRAIEQDETLKGL